MPYISPKGAVKSTIPASTPKPAAAPATQEATSGETQLYLVESEDTRPMDPKVVEELDHWKGWNARRESEAEEDDMDPLDEGKKAEGKGVGGGDLALEKDVRVEIKEVVEAI